MPTILENKPHNGTNHFIYSAGWESLNSRKRVQDQSKDFTLCPSNQKNAFANFGES